MSSQKVNIYLNAGGMGDRIAQLPAILYCIKEYKNKQFDIIVPDYFAPLARHFLLGYEERATVLPMSTMAVTVDQSAPSVVMHNMFHTTLRTHLVDHAFRIINDCDDVPLKAKQYPKLRLDEIDTVHLSIPAPYKYVVLTPAFTAPVRRLPGKVWNQIAKWLISRQVVPVWIGARENTIGGTLAPESQFADDVNYSLGYDYRDKTTLLGAAKLMALAEAVVGVDNGLLHLAATTQVPIVAGYTSVDPKTRIPYGREGLQTYIITPPDYLECKFRQTRTHFDYETDFRACPCGGECVESLTAEKFITELEKIV